MINTPLFKAYKLAGQVTVNSAVNPSLWLCVVIPLPLFYLSSRSFGISAVAYFLVGLIPIILFSFSYIYLLFKNPEYLRSEDYQMRMNSIRLLGDRDNPFHTQAEDIVAVTNPRLPKPNEQ